MARSRKGQSPATLDAFLGLDLVPQGTKHLDLDQILRAACRALHPDQVIDGGDQHLDPAQVRVCGGAGEVGVPTCPGGRAEEIKVAGIGLKGEDVSGPEGPSIRAEGQSGLGAAKLGAAKLGVDLGEYGGQRSEVGGVAGVADVQVAGDRGRSQEAARDPRPPRGERRVAPASRAGGAGRMRPVRS